MSLPREIAVKKMGNEWILVQQPVKALRSLRSTAEILKQPIPVQTNYKVPFSGQQFEMELEMKASAPCIAGVKIA
ncbi:hypothetical protein WB403_50415, partial [Streptomyces brasiliscabiei]